MNNNPDQKFQTKQGFKPDISTKSKTKKTDIYDVINSEDLDLLYKKNAQLLSRLSLTGRQNGILQVELCSLLEEKSKLDVKNNFLKTKVDSLKSQVSVFARQHQRFNQQSVRLKKELKGLKIEGFNLVNERADIVKTKSSSEKLFHYLNYRKKVTKAHGQLKEERKKMAGDFSKSSTIKEEGYKKQDSDLESIKSLIQKKEAQNLMLEKREIVHRNQIKVLEKRHLDFENKTVSSEKREIVHRNQIKVLEKRYLDFENKTVSSEKREIVHRNQIKVLEKRHLDFENKTVSSEKKEKQLHNLIQILKHQQEDLLKENESYENQVNLYQCYQEENKTLSENYKNLRTVISQHEESFKQTLISLRNKYIQAHKEGQNKSAEILRIKNLLSHSQKNFTAKTDALNKKMNLEKQKEIKNLQIELETVNSHNKEIDRRLQNLQTRQRQEVSNLQDEYLNEIQSLKLKLELKSSRFKEEQERSSQSLKNEYETRIEALNSSYQKKLQHVRTEMENDLLSERRQSEVLKNMNGKQVKEIESNLEQLQKEVHKLRTNNFVLENSNRETISKLKKEISQNEYLVTQNKNLHSLWHQIQQSLEKKEQQIQSLQKLNKNLSVSFNEISSEKKQGVTDNFQFKDDTSLPNLEFTSTKEKSNSPSKATNHILADIHFDKN